MSHSPRTITIIAPVYNEQKMVGEFLSELKKHTLDTDEYRFRYLIVDDGSTDGTLDELRRLKQKEPRLDYLAFSRNFGKEAALSAGLMLARGDALLFMDSDLQHPPELIPQMLRAWRQGYAVVRMRRRADEAKSLLRRVGSWVFYKLLNLISDTEILARATDFRLVDAQVAETLRSFTERSRMFRALVDWSGFPTYTIDFVAPERADGSSRFSTRGLLTLAVNTFTTHSLFPLKVAGYAGIALVTACALLLAFMTVDRFYFGWLGFTSLAFVVVANTLLMGVVLICLGLIALYVGHIHIEVQNRPLFVLREGSLPRAPSRTVFVPDESDSAGTSPRSGTVLPRTEPSA